MVVSKIKLGPNDYRVENVFAQLTAPGQTASVECLGIRHHLFQIKIASINTTVDFNIQGSLDNTNWFNMPTYTIASGLQQDNLSLTATTGVVQVSANGTYVLLYPNIPLKYIRFNFSAETGGTAATIDVTYMGCS